MNDITKFTKEELESIEAYNADLLILKGQAENIEDAKKKTRKMLAARFGLKSMPSQTKS